ncbi:MAG: IS91 family transposase [bacterium]|nr:IS91 family transposase [bacterium]
MAQIFTDGFESYVHRFAHLPDEQYKVAHAIMDCRTERLGGHVYRCDCCKDETVLFNSCLNRHCPKCQTYARVQWVNNRIAELLPIAYFHVVFTIPHELNGFALRNKSAFYTIMFRAVKETLLELAADKKRLGAEIGFVTILHTWGQNLMDHPHIHCIVPAGGISPDKKKWLSSRKDFLFPFSVMAKLFKGKLLSYFKTAVQQKDILFHGSLQMYDTPRVFNDLIALLYKKRWVVYAKQPFATPENVVKYLGNYTHRIAISNNRIVSVDHGRVTFTYKDYKDESKRKQMTVSVVEFIRRFMLHVVPDGFVRIRYFGFLANRYRKEKLILCIKLLEKLGYKVETNTKKKEWKDILEELTGTDPTLCPKCQKGHLVRKEEVPPKIRCKEPPPDSVW